MPGPSRTSSTADPADYRYTVGGEAYGKTHEPGDKVPDDVPESKLREWERAGVIKKQKPRKEKKD